MTIPNNCTADQATTSQLQNFTSCVFEPGDIVEVRLLPSGQSVWLTAAELISSGDGLTQANAAGDNIYVGANPRRDRGGRTADDVAVARCLFADWDGTSTEEVRGIIDAGRLPAPTLLISSGHGVHAYWRLVEAISDLADWTRLQRRLIATVASDRAIHDPPRIMRMPGFTNVKSLPYVPCQIIDADPARRYPLAQIDGVLRQLPVPGAANGYHGRPSITTSGTDALVRATAYVDHVPGVAHGERNQAAFRLAAILRNDFLLVDADAWRLLAAWNTTNQPPLDHDELTRVFASAGQNAQHPPGNRLPQPANTVTASAAVPIGWPQGNTVNVSASTPVSMIQPNTVNVSASAPRNPATHIAPHVPFPVDVLPEVVRRYVLEAATAIGCDTSYVASPLLACLARAIGNKRVIRLKRTWTEPAVLWLAVVGKSGTHKSPAIRAGTRFLDRRQEEAIRVYQEDLRQYERAVVEYERALAQWRRSRNTDPPPIKPREPICHRYTVRDITIEALADRLHSQDDGVLVVRDELAGWLDGQNQYKGGKGSDTAQWLETWSAATLTVDRKSGEKKTINIPRAAVSVVGGIQPGILKRAIGREHLQDGLCARLLLSMPEPHPIRWTEGTVSPQTEVALTETFEYLYRLTPGCDEQFNPVPLPMPLSDDAKAAWVSYYDRHRTEMAELDDDLAAAWSKLEAYTARFALIFSLVRHASLSPLPPDQRDIVDLASMQAAITLSDWFGREARRVYAILSETDSQREQRELVELIHRRGGSITARELMRSSRKYPTSDAAMAALQALVFARIAMWQLDTHGGGPGQPTSRLELVDTADADSITINPQQNGNTVNGHSVDGTALAIPAASIQPTTTPGCVSPPMPVTSAPTPLTQATPGSAPAESQPRATRTAATRPPAPFVPRQRWMPPQLTAPAPPRPPSR